MARPGLCDDSRFRPAQAARRANRLPRLETNFRAGRAQLEELGEPEAVTTATVGPLSLAGVHQLLKGRLASPPSRSVLARLPSRTREVLRAAAALEEPREETVRIGLGRPIGGDLEPAEREQVADRKRGVIMFAHPLFAEAILASSTAAERRQAHRRLAAAVEGSEKRARHLALSVDGRDEPTAATVHAAAPDARFRGAPAGAAELVELALRLGEPDSEAERRRTIDLADFLFAGGERERARTLLEGISSWAEWSSTLQARGVARLCQLVCEAEHPAAAVEFLERMLLQPLGVEARSAVHALLSYSTSEVDPARAATEAEAAVALLEPLGDDADPSIHATALYMGLRASVLLGNGLDRAVVDRIREIEARLPPERRAFDRGSPSIAYWLKHVDDLNASREWLERSLRHAMESGFEGGELHSLMHLAITECWAGRLALARRYAVSAVELAGELKAGYASLLADEALALVEAHLGNVDGVRAIVARLDFRRRRRGTGPSCFERLAALSSSRLVTTRRPTCTSARGSTQPSKSAAASRVSTACTPTPPKRRSPSGTWGTQNRLQLPRRAWRADEPPLEPCDRCTCPRARRRCQRRSWGRAGGSPAVARRQHQHCHLHCQSHTQALSASARLLLPARGREEADHVTGQARRALWAGEGVLGLVEMADDEVCRAGLASPQCPSR
jgi:hypothetical protein